MKEKGLFGILLLIFAIGRCVESLGMNLLKQSKSHSITNLRYYLFILKEIMFDW